jgi:hypothetical protein
VVGILRKSKVKHYGVKAAQSKNAEVTVMLITALEINN